LRGAPQVLEPRVHQQQRDARKPGHAHISVFTLCWSESKRQSQRGVVQAPGSCWRVSLPAELAAAAAWQPGSCQSSRGGAPGQWRPARQPRQAHPDARCQRHQLPAPVDHVQQVVLAPQHSSPQQVIDRWVSSQSTRRPRNGRIERNASRPGSWPDKSTEYLSLGNAARTGPEALVLLTPDTLVTESGRQKQRANSTAGTPQECMRPQ